MDGRSDRDAWNKGKEEKKQFFSINALCLIHSVRFQENKRIRKEARVWMVSNFPVLAHNCLAS